MVDRNIYIHHQYNSRYMDTNTYISTRISCNDADELDRLVEEGKYMNRSDAIRTAVRMMLAA